MLAAQNVTKHYSIRSEAGGSKRLTALGGVSVSLIPGRTIGLVGESGSGKSTLGRILAGLEKPDGGAVTFEGAPIIGSSPSGRRKFRRAVQVVFQNPMNALNPRWTVRSILEEPFRVNGESASNIGRLLEEVHLPLHFLTRRPGELSGGERQRVCIARALALKPRIVICDEAVSSLDVLVRAEILNLLLELQRSHGIGYLFISHDISVVRHMSDDLVVMKDGQVVEFGPAADILASPRSAYTRTLLDAAYLKL